MHSEVMAKEKELRQARLEQKQEVRALHLKLEDQDIKFKELKEAYEALALTKARPLFMALLCPASLWASMLRTQVVSAVVPYVSPAPMQEE